MRKLKNAVGISKEHVHHVPFRFLLYSWGSLIWVPISAPFKGKGYLRRLGNLKLPTPLRPPSRKNPMTHASEIQTMGP